MALRPSIFRTFKSRPDFEKELDNHPLPTDEDVAKHLGIKPEIFNPSSKAKPNGGEQTQALNPQPEEILGPREPGEGSV